MGNSLLLTATVTPQSQMRNLQVSDPGKRLEQYREAFRGLVQRGDTRRFETIHIVENSGCSPAAFEGIIDGAEFVSVEPDQANGAFARVYPEMIMIGRALKQSPLLQTMPAHQRIWKLTGRYQILNLGRIVDKTPDDVSFAFNIKRYPKPWVDLYLYAFDRSLWSVLDEQVDALREYDVATMGERTMAGILEGKAKQFRMSLRLPLEPELYGIRGYDGREYHSGKLLAKRYLRQVARVLAPGLWV